MEKRWYFLVDHNITVRNITKFWKCAGASSQPPPSETWTNSERAKEDMEKLRLSWGGGNSSTEQMFISGLRYVCNQLL